MEFKATPPKTARIVMTAFAVAVLIKAFFFDIMISEGRSMLPAIRPGTVVLINKVAYGLRNPFANGYLIYWGEPHEGDIVVFPSPDGVLAVKRYHHSPYADKFLAVGDNAEESYDSRMYGPVAVESILGKVMGIK